MTHTEKKSAPTEASCSCARHQRIRKNRNPPGPEGQCRELSEVSMNWPVIMSGIICAAMLALGFNLLVPLGSGLEAVCLLTGVASAMVFLGLVDGA